MPSRLVIDPTQVRRSGALRLGDIPLNTYAPDLEAERRARGDDELRSMLRAMIVIREFESALGALKSQSRYGDLQYAYIGPAHLSIGQEAVAAGTAASLTVDDHIFGSHRSHGEVIAKGMRAVAVMNEDALKSVVASYRGGRAAELLDAEFGPASPSERGHQFLLFGLIAEIFGREIGFNRGMGGSMHAFYPPFGIMPNNAIVGGSAGIAAGSALHARVTKHGRVAVANLGDGATGCGPVFEAMNFSSMAQFSTLWGGPAGGGLPALFLFVNNFYAMGGQPLGETHGYDRLARVGAAFNPRNLNAETVDGTDVLAVADAVRRHREILLGGLGPSLLDVQCYRSVGHSTTDGNVYRSKAEVESWRELDAIGSYARKLLDVGVISDDYVASETASAARLVLGVARIAADRNRCPAVDTATDPIAVGRLMFNGTHTQTPAGSAADLLAAPEELARIRQLSKRSRSGVGESGESLSPSRAVTVRDALFEAVLDRALHDPTLAIWGEEVREWGGAFGVYRGLSDLLPYPRLFNSAISEAAIIATAVGYAMEGGRALVELMYADFIGRAGDELMNQLAKWQAMSGGELALPVVVRVSVGSKYGAQHSQDVTSALAQIPGLRVAYPVTPYDAKGILIEALAANDPTVILESQRQYDAVEIYEREVPSRSYQIEAGISALRRSGADATVVTVGATLSRAMSAATSLDELGVTTEVIDARWIVPFDLAAVVASASRTRRLVLVSDAAERGSVLHTWATAVANEVELDSPPQVVGAPNWIVPNAEMEDSYYPQPADIVAAVARTMSTHSLAQRVAKLSSVGRVANQPTSAEMMQLGL